MDFLDIRTIMFGQFITDAACAAVLVFLWLQNRQRFTGTSYWMVDFIFQTTAVLLIILRGSIPDGISMGVSNTLVIAGALMGLWGLERFIGKRSSPIPNAILLAVFISIQFFFIYGKNDLDARTLNLSAALLIVCAQCAWLMLRRAGRSQARFTRTVGWVFGVFCLVNGIRIIIILAFPLTTNDFFHSGLYDALALIAYQILLILLAFGLALMVNRRLLMDVRMQEEKLTKTFHSSPYAILITRLSDGLILDVNRGFEEMTGYLAAEVIGQTTIHLGLWAKAMERQAVAEEFSTRGEVHGKEFQFRMKSGGELTGLYYGEILIVDDERLVLSSISDITERKRAEAEIRYQASLLENVNDAIVASDAEFRLTAWNAAAEKLYGWKAGEVLGKPGLEITRTEWPAADAEDMRRMIADQGHWRGEATQVRKNGTRIPVEVSSMVLRDSDGRTAGYISINRDISDRRRAEEEIALLAKFPSENPNPVLRLAHDGTVLFANDASQTLLAEWGCAVGEPAPKPWRDAAAESLEQAASTTVETQSGGRHYSFAVNPVLEADYVNLYGRDETGRKQAEEALEKTLADLERSNTELEQFAYVASHDLQEPLRMVSSYTQLLARRYQGKLDSDADEFIGYAVDGATRMQRLIDDLLSYSRAGAQGNPPGPVPADLALDRALENLTLTLEENQAKVKREPLPTVKIDDVQLTQVFQNLIANAIKFRGDGPPRIHIASAARGSEWIFSVRDNGIGIDPQNLERIFVIFQRLNPRGRYPGTGIGLAMCKKIILRHGGRIWVESEPGKGSTFYFSLPRTGGDRE